MRARTRAVSRTYTDTHTQQGFRETVTVTDAGQTAQEGVGNQSERGEYAGKEGKGGETGVEDGWGRRRRSRRGTWGK